MNQPIPNALANTVLLADHDEATQRAVVDAVEKIVHEYLQKNMHSLSSSVVNVQHGHIAKIAMRAVKNHFVNASNIY
jgi:hypothetical protein